MSFLRISPAIVEAPALQDPEKPIEDLAPSQRRLQRPADFTGDRLSSVAQVFLRHGLPVAVLAALCLLLPDAPALLVESLSSLRAMPHVYAAAGTTLLAGMLAYAYFLDRRLDAATLGWILYLLAVSIWEEWFFRLALPYSSLTDSISLPVLVIGSNLAFGAIHYFTLRWKWPWCLAAFLGGMALSRNLNLHFDLALIIAIHWLATFLNTPRPPGRSGRNRTARTEL